MHAAWRKRGEQAEAERDSLREQVATVQQQAMWFRWIEKHLSSLEMLSYQGEALMWKPGQLGPAIVAATQGTAPLPEKTEGEAL